jgi:hypothetical protein
MEYGPLSFELCGAQEQAYVLKEPVSRSMYWRFVGFDEEGSIVLYYKLKHIFVEMCFFCIQMME